MIKVTEKDKAEGKKGHCSKCPVALATLRRLRKLGIEPDVCYSLLSGSGVYHCTPRGEPHSTLVVGEGTLRFRYKGNLYIYLLPTKATKFIQNFDDYLDPKPISFEAIKWNL